MEIYLVGGAVRDKLLGLPIHEHDWVVVGATPREMLELKYKAVGKDFPVFLHPTTHEEYALARTERKIAKGYKGFSFYTSPEVTLEEDLARRDLTINAIAEDAEGNLIDPYHGQEDLNNKILRHVSPAFQEDPVRILRAARFAAKFPDFQIHPETLQFMKSMVAAGEVNALVSERVWQECVRALKERSPKRFFEVLEQVGALAILFPEVSSSDNLMHATEDPLINWALLVHNCSVEQIASLTKRLRCPKEYTDFAVLVSKHLINFEKLNTQDVESILNLILKTDALRRPERFKQFIETACLIKPELSLSKNIIEKALHTLKHLNLQDLQAQELSGEAFAQALYLKRLNALQDHGV